MKNSSADRRRGGKKNAWRLQATAIPCVFPSPIRREHDGSCAIYELDSANRSTRLNAIDVGNDLGFDQIPISLIDN